VYLFIGLTRQGGENAKKRGGERISSSSLKTSFFEGILKGAGKKNS